MSDTKRILPWEFRDNAHNVAQAITKVDLYWIHPKEGKFMACIDDEVLNSISTHDTLDAAMDACEADYISRCTEFLTLYNPATHVVVSREAAIALLMNVRGIDDANFAAADLTAALEGK